jgi:hypothetical protein
VCKDSVVEEGSPYDRGPDRLTDQDWDDRCLSLPDVESDRAKTVGDTARVVPETFAAVWFSNQNVERGERSGN